MKSEFAILVAVLGCLGLGFLLEPFMMPEKQKVVQQELPPPPEPIEEPIVEPEPVKEPEIVQEETPEEPEEVDDPETTDVKKMEIVQEDNVQPVEEKEAKKGPSPTEWTHPKQLQKKLASRIRTGLSHVNKDSVLKFIKTPENRLAVTQWELLNRADLDKLEDLMKGKGVADSLVPLLNDLQWVSTFVYDGELESAETALAMVYDFRQADPKMDEDVTPEDDVPVRPGVKKRIAAAVAVEFTRNGWYSGASMSNKGNADDSKNLGSMPGTRSRKRKAEREAQKNAYLLARERYLFFAESWDQGLLNSQFGNLPDWLLHFPCGWKGDSPFGSAGSMRWMRDNTSAPAIKFTDMAFQVPYLPLNTFGDTIFTPLYYEPFNVLYPDNFAKAVRDIGAVCGGCSHFGASSSCANGVPAITVGEPGHCSYAVYADGKWHPNFTISDERHPHWKVWGMNTWSALEMMSDMYAEGQRTRDAQLMTSLGSVMLSNHSADKALQVYEMAVTMQPLYNPVWKLYLQAAAKSLSRHPSRSLGVNDFVCSSVAPKHPEMCALYLTETIYPSLLKALRTSKQKMIAFKSFFDNLDVNEKAEWDLQKLLNLQYDSIGKSFANKERYLRMVADTVNRRPKFGPALSWAMTRAYGESRRMGDKVRGIVDKLLEALPKDEAEAQEKHALLSATVVRAAEEMCAAAMVAPGRLNPRDLNYFLDLANKYSAPYLEAKDEDKMPDFPKQEGKLVSEGGMVMMEKYNPDQKTIVQHAAALTARGGRILSEKGIHVKIMIQLPEPANITSVVIVPTEGCKKYREWNIETSSDGKNWELLADLPDSKDEAYALVDLEGRSRKAKFLRIDSGAEQMVGIDFRAVLVYDKHKK